MARDGYRRFHFNVRRIAFDEVYHLSIKRNLSLDELALRAFEMFVFLATEDLLGSTLFMKSATQHFVPFSVVTHAWHGENPSLHEEAPICCFNAPHPHRLIFELPASVLEQFAASPIAKRISEQRAIASSLVLFVFFDRELEDGGRLFMKSLTGKKTDIFIF